MLLRAVFVIVLAFASGMLGMLALQPRRQAPPPTPVAVAPVAPAPAPVAPVARAVLVAARPLAAGTLIRDEDFASRDVSPAEMPPGAMENTGEVRTELRGTLVRRFIPAGAAVTRADILRPEDRGFLAAVLQPGTRAISVGVDAVTGAAGLIWPGDQVDLILTQELEATNAPLARRVIGETIMSDIRVIAVDQQFTQGASAVPASGAPGVPNQRSVARTLTLQVSAEQAERIAVAERLGRLSVTVRAMEAAPDDLLSEARPSSVFGGDVSPALSRTGSAIGTRMRVIQGQDLQEVVFR